MGKSSYISKFLFAVGTLSLLLVFQNCAKQVSSESFETTSNSASSSDSGGVGGSPAPSGYEFVNPYEDGSYEPITVSIIAPDGSSEGTTTSDRPIGSGDTPIGGTGGSTSGGGTSGGSTGGSTGGSGGISETEAWENFCYEGDYAFSRRAIGEELAPKLTAIYHIGTGDGVYQLSDPVHSVRLQSRYSKNQLIRINCSSFVAGRSNQPTPFSALGNLCIRASGQVHYRCDGLKWSIRSDNCACTEHYEPDDR